MPITPKNDTAPVPAPALDGVLQGPQAVLAAVPYLLGFRPQSSVVVVWMRERRICLTQRMDLPPRALDASADVLASVQAVAASCQADSALVVTYALDDHADRGWRPDIHAAMAELLDGANVQLLDALHVHRDRWWSYGCEGPCCPAQGRTIAHSVHEQVAALLAEPGSEPAGSRDEVVRSLGRLPAAVAELEPALKARLSALCARFEAAASPEDELECWRDECLAELLPVIRGVRPLVLREGNDLDAMAMTLVALRDIRIRDTLLWHLAATANVAPCMESLVAAMRAAPQGHVAPVATCVAICAWITGDGVRANAALERALADDEHHSLAWLVGRSIAHGLPPAAWKEIMAALSEEDCRMGTAAPQAGLAPDSPAGS